MLGRHLRKWQPEVVPLLRDLPRVAVEFVEGQKAVDAEVAPFFPKTSALRSLRLVRGEKEQKSSALRIGAVFSGGQASGGHNVIAGLFDGLKQLHKESVLLGFLQGPSGILRGLTHELTKSVLAHYRNQGGFDLLGSGRTKIETEEQLTKSAKVAKELQLDGILIIGGDDSNTNAALMAEFFLQKELSCAVLGAPKTIDGDLQTEEIPLSFGFDTACRIYSNTIGNLARDAQSAGKYYFFIKLMGRSASHIALECAHQTHPNLALIGEEVQEKGWPLQHLVSQIADLIEERARRGQEHGVILIPEGILEFIPEVGELIASLNRLLAEGRPPEELEVSSLSLFKSLPEFIQEQLLLERDAHGNVQLAKIETERLFIAMVAEELKQRSYQGSFRAQPFYCGYEGRSAYPSRFDATYCYNLGLTAAALFRAGMTGYCTAIAQLERPVHEWQPGGAAIAPILHMEERKGRRKPVIRKALVALDSPQFQEFAEKREAWRLSDDYRYPGPIQYFGLEDLMQRRPKLLLCEEAPHLFWRC